VEPCANWDLVVINRSCADTCDGAWAAWVTLAAVVAVVVVLCHSIWWMGGDEINGLRRQVRRGATCIAPVVLVVQVSEVERALRLSKVKGLVQEKTVSQEFCSCWCMYIYTLSTTSGI
jgi:hypothetical protein